MSLVMECLAQYGIEGSDVIPAMEGGNIDMVAEYMSKEGREARSNILKANRLFKSGNYKQAEKLYTESKECIANIRKTCSHIPTNVIVDEMLTYGYVLSMFIPIVNLLTTLPIIIERLVLAGDSYSMIDQSKLYRENGNTSNYLRNIIEVNCRTAEIACDDKIRRCKQARR